MRAGKQGKEVGMLITLLNAKLFSKRPFRVLADLGEPEIVFLPVDMTIRDIVNFILTKGMNRPPFVELPVLGSLFASIFKDYPSIKAFRLAKPEGGTEADHILNMRSYNIVQRILKIQELVVPEGISHICVIADSAMVPWLLLDLAFSYNHAIPFWEKCVAWEMGEKLGVRMDTVAETLTDIVL